MISIDAFIDHLNLSIGLFKPEIALLVTFVLAILFDLLFKKVKNIAGIVAILGFIATGFYLGYQCTDGADTFSGLLVIDPFSRFFKFVILISSLIVVLMSFSSKELNKDGRSVGEYYTLILGMTFGMFLLASASNLIMIYLAIETMSLSSYVLAGYTKEIKRASEASLKYVIFGAVSSGLMIYGMSLLYGLTGSLNLISINSILATADVNLFALFFASILIIGGIGYKISAVPFHFWTPDVYEGAPVTITAYLSVASKAAGFAILIRFVKYTFIDTNAVAGDGLWGMMEGIDWQFVIAIFAVLTATLGNLVAVWQTNVKRMLAYSSIAHAGYLLMAVAVMNDIGVAAVMIYFVFYMIMNLGAFAVVMLIANKIGSEEIDDYVGIGHRAPVLGACMVIFLVSLTGLPPTAGFIGKFFVFAAILDSGMIWLAVIGVLNSVVSLFYYVKIFRNMYVRGTDSKDIDTPFSVSPVGTFLVILLAIPTLLFGLWYTPVMEWAKNSVVMFIGK